MATPPSHTHVHADAGTIVKVIAAGTVVGLLTGFFGVGGGFVIVPALILVLGFTMPEAVGTSLLVITINSLVALATRLQAGVIEWDVVVPFTIASCRRCHRGQSPRRVERLSDAAEVVRRVDGGHRPVHRNP